VSRGNASPWRAIFGTDSSVEGTKGTLGHWSKGKRQQAQALLSFVFLMLGVWREKTSTPVSLLGLSKF